MPVASAVSCQLSPAERIVISVAVSTSVRPRGPGRRTGCPASRSQRRTVVASTPSRAATSRVLSPRAAEDGQPATLVRKVAVAEAVPHAFRVRSPGGQPPAAIPCVSY